MGSPKAPAGQSPETAARNDLNPKLELKQVPLCSLKPPVHPVRQVSGRQIKKVARSIEEFGAVDPVLALGDGEIIDGVSRFEAARRLGLETIPCIFIDHLSERQVRLLRLSMNKIAASGAFDPEALRLEIAYQLELGADVTLTGFEPPEIDNILQFGVGDPAHHDPLDDVVNLPEPLELGVSQTGDPWLVGEHRVLCGNARVPGNWETLIEDDTPTLLLTDPPLSLGDLQYCVWQTRPRPALGLAARAVAWGSSADRRQT